MSMYKVYHILGLLNVKPVQNYGTNLWCATWLESGLMMLCDIVYMSALKMFFYG